MRLCPRCSSVDLTRDGHDQRGRVVYACAGCGRHATTESLRLVSGHRFPRDVILLAVRYYLQLGAAAERIAGLLAGRGIDVSRRTILRRVSSGRHQRGETSQSHEVVGGADQVAGEVDSLQAAVARLPEPTDGFHPAEEIFGWMLRCVCAPSRWQRSPARQ